MPRSAYLIMAIIAISFAAPVRAQVDDEEEAYKTKVPVGMEAQQVGKKPAYKVVLPKGTALRREGDLRIVEGTGEYASRKFVAYDAMLDKMNAEIAALRKDLEELKKSISEMRKDKLVSK